MSNFWSLWIIVIVVLNIGGCAVLLLMTRKTGPSDTNDGTTGHEYDGIREYNNPLPGWWMWLFWITIVFAVVYLALYPGLGKFSGTLGWKSHGAYVNGQDQDDQKHPSELAAAKTAYDAQYSPLYTGYASIAIADLAKKPDAMAVASRLFAVNCSMCHGTDAKGNVGFPNLTDNDWLYGGAPEQIEATILDGHLSIGMPAWTQDSDATRPWLKGNPAFNADQVKQVALYVRTLSGAKPKDVEAAGSQADYDKAVAAGQQTFATFCTACHGADAKGMQAMGAPNLTDDIWLYGGSLKTIEETISNGRKGQMPAQKDALGPEKVHLLAAYVWSLSNH